MSNYETRLFIAGEFVNPAGGKTFDLPNPLDPEGAPLAQVAVAEKEDVDRAVAAAKVAQQKWAAVSAAEKSAALLKFADLVEKNGEKLKELDRVAMGRPINTQFIDIGAVTGNFRSMAGLATYVQGASSLNTPGILGMTLRQPFGVVGAIIPWNVPMMMWAAKVGPAVAAGNAIVIKTSEKAPLSGAFLASLTVEAGFPPGLVNNISGPGTTGQILSEHMEIRAISFTGSTRTGRFIQEAAARSNLKKVSMELGGKSPTLIFDDADLAEAIPATTFSISWNSGQVCIANSRIYVQDTVYPKFLEAFKTAFGEKKHGDPADAATAMGPQADAIQGKSVLNYLEVGKTEGKLELGGSRAEGKGYNIQPTIFTDVPDTARISREEIFGPVVVINTFKTEEEAIRRANDTEYGLYASVWTKDIDRALRVAKALESGVVGVNATSPTMASDLPFGGYKQSGLGREGGSHSLDEWLETKSIVFKVKGF